MALPDAVAGPSGPGGSAGVEVDRMSFDAFLATGPGGCTRPTGRW